MCFGVQYLFCLPSYNGNYFFKPFERKKTGGKEKKKKQNKSGPQKSFSQTHVFGFSAGGSSGSPMLFLGK